MVKETDDGEIQGLKTFDEIRTPHTFENTSAELFPPNPNELDKIFLIG